MIVILGGSAAFRLPWAAVFPNSKHSSAHSRHAPHTLQLHLNKLKPLVLSIIVSMLHICSGHQLVGTVLQGATEILRILDSDCESGAGMGRGKETAWLNLRSIRTPNLKDVRILGLFSVSP